jgi:SOS-response transcriptional repressor LexA
LGVQIRRQRRRLGLTLDELAGRTSISKPYLSLIETGRVSNPPSDEKLVRLEQSLGFASGELLGQAHLQRTPSDVRAVLSRLTQTADDTDLSEVFRRLLGKSGHGSPSVTANVVPVINDVSIGQSPTAAVNYVSCPDIADENAFAARVAGDSMMPRYREGDVVIFAPSLPARNGDDCFVRFDDGQTAFKRVFMETDEAGAAVMRLQPRNEKYRPQIVQAQRVAGIYRAVYRYERVDGET